MVLKLYGFTIATCTKRVACVLHEKNVPFEFVNIDLLNDEHKSPTFLAKQPFGQVPFIDDDGFMLYESRAICRYIAEKYADQGTQLIPTDIKKRALFEQAASIETANFDNYASPLAYEIVITKARGLEPNAQKVEELTKTVDAKLNVYNKILERQEYIGGDEVSLVDLFHLPYGSLLPICGCNSIQEKANVNRWFTAIENRPSWQAVKDGVKSTA